MVQCNTSGIIIYLFPKKLMHRGQQKQLNILVVIVSKLVTHHTHDQICSSAVTHKVQLGFCDQNQRFHVLHTKQQFFSKHQFLPLEHSMTFKNLNLHLLFYEPFFIKKILKKYLLSHLAFFTVSKEQQCISHIPNYSKVYKYGFMFLFQMADHV